MPDQKSPVDRLLDVVLYAPLGFVMNFDELLPQLVEKGHQQVNMARMFGQFAVQTGGKEARKRVEQMSGQVGELVNRRSSDGHAPTPSPVSIPDAGGPAPEPEPGLVPDAGGLGITDYDALSASQVVPRLAGLGELELEAVRRYESANRGRKTILAKIAQLQA